MNLRPTRLLPVLLVATVAGLVVPAFAGGSPVDDKRAEATQLQADIDANGRRIDQLSEQANGARYRLEQATAAAEDAQARIDAARAQADQVRGVVQKRAAAIYKSAGNATPLDAIDVGGATAYDKRSKYATAAAGHDNALVDQLRSAEEELSARKQEYDTTIEQAKQEQAAIAASQHEIEAANARQSQLLAQVNGEIATLVEQERQRQEAEEAARARALVARRSSPRSGSDSSEAIPANLPPASGGTSTAIAFAEAQLGKPYVYAAAGPDAYDCSGLTMRAWEAAGVSMPHYSGAQYDMFPHVPLDAMEPGDLIFWGSGGGDHVAMYLGGGQMIAAPHTGDVVKISPIWGQPVGAARPG